jgi:glycosyltransferase involved in cell wall biosynthesis
MSLEIYMPFYGDPAHFREAVQSILAQSDSDWKLTVVDDVYPDVAPGKWLQSLGDKRITYIRNTTNLKPSANYNKCAKLAKSDFLVLMGCDDIMLPCYISRVKSLINAFPSADIIQPGVSVIDENGNPQKPLADRIKGYIAPSKGLPREFSGQRLEKSLLRGNWTYFPSLVWRRSLISKLVFREDLNVVQDLMMLLKITESGGTLVRDSEIVFNYRRHLQSVSGKQGADGRKFAQEFQLYKETSERARKLGWRGADRLARIHFLSRADAAFSLVTGWSKSSSESKQLLLRHIFN